MTYQGRWNAGAKVIKVEGGREKKEVIVRHEAVSSKWKTWHHDHVSCEWNKNDSV